MPVNYDCQKCANARPCARHATREEFKRRPLSIRQEDLLNQITSFAGAYPTEHIQHGVLVSGTSYQTAEALERRGLVTIQNQAQGMGWVRLVKPPTLPGTSIEVTPAALQYVTERIVAAFGPLALGEVEFSRVIAFTRDAASPAPDSEAQGWHDVIYVQPSTFESTALVIQIQPDGNVQNFTLETPEEGDFA